MTVFVLHSLRSVICCSNFITESNHVSDPFSPDPANSHVNEGQIVAKNAYDEPSNPHESQTPYLNEDTVELHFQSNQNVDDSQATELNSSAQKGRFQINLVHLL